MIFLTLTTAWAEGMTESERQKLLSMLGPDARERRLRVLAAEARSPLQRLFPSAGAHPGNLVVADAAELRDLRRELSQGALTPAKADEFRIPREYARETLRTEPARDAFLRRRLGWLSELEQAHQRNTGLQPHPGAPSPEPTEPDDDRYEAENTPY